MVNLINEIKLEDCSPYHRVIIKIAFFQGENFITYWKMNLQREQQKTDNINAIKKLILIILSTYFILIAIT